MSSSSSPQQGPGGIQFWATSKVRDPENYTRWNNKTARGKVIRKIDKKLSEKFKLTTKLTRLDLKATKLIAMYGKTHCEMLSGAYEPTKALREDEEKQNDSDKESCSDTEESGSSK